MIANCQSRFIYAHMNSHAREVIQFSGGLIKEDLYKIVKHKGHTNLKFMGIKVQLNSK